MDETLSTTINLANGEQQSCVLKAKVNNGNGKLLYRFYNEDCGEEYLLSKEGDEWSTLNNCKLPSNNIKELTDYADGLDAQKRSPN